MAAYLTAAKQAEIVKKYHPALPKSAMQYLLTEIAAAIAQAEGLAEESADIFVKKLSATIAYDDFTDNEDTTGTYEFASDIPVGAMVLGIAITDVTGFTGDTSAVITVGDGTDVDRYNTGTPNVFATADAVDPGVVSGVPFHAAAKTPTVILTSATDFGAVSAGNMKIDIFYVENND